MLSNVNLFLVRKCACSQRICVYFLWVDCNMVHNMNMSLYVFVLLPVSQLFICSAWWAEPFACPGIQLCRVCGLIQLWRVNMLMHPCIVLPVRAAWVGWG